MMDLGQHQAEIQRNLAHWRKKPLLQQVYAGFYRRILECIDPRVAGLVVEIGSGIGNLKTHYSAAVSTDLFPNPWLDLVCDGYELPFRDGSVSHLVLFDVFHHLEMPAAFLREARRVLVPGGRLIIFDPYISAASYPVYGLLHHEPVALRQTINPAPSAPRPRSYYAAQGNATRVFFQGGNAGMLAGWQVLRAQAFASFAYLLSGGYSKPAAYPASALPWLEKLDAGCSRWPGLFAARCLVCLSPEPSAQAPGPTS